MTAIEATCRIRTITKHDTTQETLQTMTSVYEWNFIVKTNHKKTEKESYGTF